MRKPFRFLWVSDPWPMLDQPGDTSLRLAQEAELLGAESWWNNHKTIECRDGKVQLTYHPLRFGKDRVEFGPGRRATPLDFDSLQYRVDPPLDLDYLQPLRMLALSLRCHRGKKPEIVNTPETLLFGNEKTEAMLEEALAPPSLVSAQWESMLAFGRKLGRTVVKPLHQAQSKGVELLNWKTDEDVERNRQLITQMTNDGRTHILLQKFLPGIAEGEQRLWFVDGKLLAYARKLPLQDDFRVNIDRGSRLVVSTLTAREKRAISKIQRRLRDRRIRLAAIDLIEGQVTDFNFTSPGLICQMEGVLGINLARPIVKALMKKQ